MFPVLQSSFFGIQDATWHAMELGSKAGTFGTFQLFFLLVSLLLIVFSKAGNTQSFRVLLKIFFQPGQTESQKREGWPMLGSPAWFLAFNFVITLAHSIYLIISDKQGESLTSIVYALGISLGFFMLAFVAMSFVAFLTGLKSIYQVPLQTTWVLPQFVGLIFFLLNLIWVLNPSYADILVLLLFTLFFLLNFKRIIRSSLFLLRKGVEWYYILLYLCTLEILPISILAWFLYTWMFK